MRKKGFTLIELIMVIVIIGILAAIAIPKFIDLRKDARQASCKASGGALRAAISSYYASAVLSSPSATKHWPTACTSAPGTLGPYMQSWPLVPTSPSTTWQSGYTSNDGVLNVDSLCPKK